MSLANSKVSEILFHTYETTSILAGNPPNMGNCGIHCLSLAKSLMAKITQTSKVSIDYTSMFGK